MSQPTRSCSPCCRVEDEQWTRTDVILVDIGVDQAQLSLVLGVFERRFDDLVHGRDTGSAGNHEQMRDHVGAISSAMFGCGTF